jgi:glucokinase
LTVRPALYGAIDLGGTKVRAIVADLDGNVYGEDIRRSEAQRGLEATLERMRESLAAALKGAGVGFADLKGVGIASPGPVDVSRGVVSEAPQLPGWKDVPLAELMGGRLGVPVIVENDATAAAIGENRYGAGRGSRYMIYITVSTGVGGGIIIDGNVYHGASGAAGELGHIIIDIDGPPCGCGGRGCLESLASGTAIARKGREAVERGEAPVLARLAEEEGGITARLMFRAAQEGDEVSRRIFREAGHYLGAALASYVNIFNPEVILIGGGVASAAEFFMAEARSTMESLAMSAPLEQVRLDLGSLKDRAGPLGMIARLNRGVGD